MIVASSVTLTKFLNVSDRDLEWVDPFGRRQRLARGRGGHFAACPELAELVGQGAVIQPRDKRLDAITLPNSTDRLAP